MAQYHSIDCNAIDAAGFIVLTNDSDASGTQGVGNPSIVVEIATSQAALQAASRTGGAPVAVGSESPVFGL